MCRTSIFYPIYSSSVSPPMRQTCTGSPYILQRHIFRANLRSRAICISPHNQSCNSSLTWCSEVVKSIHGVPESWLHWYLTNLNHYEHNLGMARRPSDPSVLVRRSSSQLEKIIILQVHEILGIGENIFLQDE